MKYQHITNDESQKKFYDGLAKLNFDTEKLVQKVEATGEVCYLTDEPGGNSLLPAQMLAVHSLDELKALAGNPDAAYQSGEMEEHLHEALPACPAEHTLKARSELSPDENNAIVKAFETYIYGNSDKVKSYKDAIHHQYFPMKVAVYAADDLTVKAGTTFVVKGSDAIAHFNTVTVEKGASLQFEVNAQWTVQSMISEV